MTTKADDRYCYCPHCAQRGRFAGTAPHDAGPCPLLVAESAARVRAMSSSIGHLVVVGFDGVPIGELRDNR